MKPKGQKSKTARGALTCLVIATLSLLPLLAQSGANTGLQGRVSIRVAEQSRA